jgi:hypothetical protein
VNYMRAAGSNGLRLFDNNNKGIIVRNGKIGINVHDPEYGMLCIHAGTDVAGIKLTNDVTGPGYNDGFLLSWLSTGNSAVVLWNRENTPLIFATNNTQRMQIKENGYVGIGQTTINHPLHMGSGAYCSLGGAWTNASSKNLKENIRKLTLKEALEALEQLDPVKFNYLVEKDETYLGFIAEDVPELLATKNRDGLSPMDIIAVLTRVLQQQQKEIEALKQKLANH